MWTHCRAAWIASASTTWVALLLLTNGCGSQSERRSTLVDDYGEVGVLQQKLNFAGDLTCTTSQQQQTNEVDARVQYADLVAQRAAANFASSSTPLYVRWFGTWNSTRGTTVKATLDFNFNNRTSFTGDCNQGTISGTCNPPPGGLQAFAWTQRSVSTTAVHLCSQFFSGFETPYATGDQNKGETLTHEKSHLSSASVVDQSDAACGGATCYGASNARALAAASASKAVANAENYGMFVQDVYVSRVLYPLAIRRF